MFSVLAGDPVHDARQYLRQGFIVPALFAGEHGQRLPKCYKSPEHARPQDVKGTGFAPQINCPTGLARAAESFATFRLTLQATRKLASARYSRREQGLACFLLCLVSGFQPGQLQPWKVFGCLQFCHAHSLSRSTVWKSHQRMPGRSIRTPMRRLASFRSHESAAPRPNSMYTKHPQVCFCGSVGSSASKLSLVAAPDCKAPQAQE